MDLISVIIPVYNTEKYLDACVESVAGQTYRELEIILVDDGSTDSCPQKCDAWARRDARVKVIHKPNGGLSDARNAGLRVSTGEYVGFVDSDDIISSDMYSCLMSAALKEKAELVQCCEVLFYEGEKPEFDSINIEIKSYDTHNAVKELIDGAISVICCSMLIKSSVAKRIEFDIGKTNEDVLWSYRAVSQSIKSVKISAQLYGYLQREGSIMNSNYSVKRFDGIEAMKKRAEEIAVLFPDLYPLAERSYAGSCMYHYQLLCRLEDSDEYRSFRKRLHKLFCDSDLKSVFAVTGLKYRIWYTLFRLAPSLTCRIRNLLKIGL